MLESCLVTDAPPSTAQSARASSREQCRWDPVPPGIAGLTSPTCNFSGAPDVSQHLCPSTHPLSLSPFLMCIHP